jgi:hypothetical protein
MLVPGYEDFPVLELHLDVSGPPEGEVLAGIGSKLLRQYQGTHPPPAGRRKEPRAITW